MPDAKMHKLKIGSYICSFREAPLTLTTLAALTPDGFDIRIVDGSIEPIPLDYPANLVGISVLTGTAVRAYEISMHFRKRGIPVVLGGVHTTIMMEEARQHADAVVIGLAERTWPKLLHDFQEGKMKDIYTDNDWPEGDILPNVPAPRIDLLRRSRYVVPSTVQATRGCRHRCDFCSVSAVWPRYYKRPIEDVIRDIKRLPGTRVAFNDVSLVDDVDYSKELFKAMIPLKKKWGGLATTLVVRDAELLDLMQKSGCVYLLLGLESSNQKILRDIHKGFNKEDDYEELMRNLHERGISVQGCFVFGFDEDNKLVFEETVQRVSDLHIDIPRYSIYTPYPGTALFQKMQSENRILSYNWDNYDTMHVVFEPAKMSPEELYEGFKWAYRETFKLSNILNRTIFQNKTSPLINFVGNLAYRIFVKRLYSERRFMFPYSD